MKCPTCDERLMIAERQGIEIDYCQNCRGVWLDRGELDKIIERTTQFELPPEKMPLAYDKPGDYGNPQFYDDHSKYGKKQRKKKHFLKEIFDVFD